MLKDCVIGHSIESLNSIIFISLESPLGKDNKSIILYNISTKKFMK